MNEELALCEVPPVNWFVYGTSVVLVNIDVVDVVYKHIYCVSEAGSVDRKSVV